MSAHCNNLAGFAFPVLRQVQDDLLLTRHYKCAPAPEVLDNARHWDVVTLKTGDCPRCFTTAALLEAAYQVLQEAQEAEVGRLVGVVADPRASSEAKLEALSKIRELTEDDTGVP
jgi:hypothetical protein